MTTERRRFIVKASGAMAAVAAGAIVDAPHVIAQPKVQWRMSTTATPTLDIQHGAAERLAKIVEETSSGRFRIDVFPAGQIMPAFDCFAATSQGKIEAFMASSYYWNERECVPSGHVPEPAVEWFTTIPFGMNPEGMAAWFFQRWLAPGTTLRRARTIGWSPGDAKALGLTLPPSLLARADRVIE